MPTCNKCSKPFPNRIKIEGKTLSIHKRKYCIECSPLGTRKFCGPKPNPNRTFKAKEAPKVKNNALRAQQVAAKRREKKRWAVEKLGGKCVKCGYSKCLGAMEFHHLNPSLKEFEIGSSLDSNKVKLEKELEKCELLCCRCHAEVHDSTFYQVRSSISRVPDCESGGSGA